MEKACERADEPLGRRLEETDTIDIAWRARKQKGRSDLDQQLAMVSLDLLTSQTLDTAFNSHTFLCYRESSLRGRDPHVRGHKLRNISRPFHRHIHYADGNPNY